VAVIEVNRYIDREVSKIPRVDVATSATPHGGANFLIVGSDSREFVSTPEEALAFGDEHTQGGPPRSDTLMVLHAEGERSYLVSFPRHLWVSIPGHGNGKINAAFNAGPQTVVDLLRSDFDVEIHHYLEVDFKSFQGIVDAIGTVSVSTPAAARDEFTGLTLP